MGDAISVGRKRGRPRVGSVNIGVRIAPDLLAALDSFRATHDDSVSRSEAIRRLVSDGLKAGGHLRVEDEGIRPDQLNSANDG